MKEKQVSVVKIPELLPCKATFPFDAITRAKSDQCPPSNINSKKKKKNGFGFTNFLVFYKVVIWF